MVYDMESEAVEYMKDRAKDYMEGVVKQLYSDEPFDEDDLVHCVEELAALFDVSMPKKSLLRIVPEKYRPYLLKNVGFNE